MQALRRWTILDITEPTQRSPSLRGRCAGWSDGGRGICRESELGWVAREELPMQRELGCSKNWQMYRLMGSLGGIDEDEPHFHCVTPQCVYEPRNASGPEARGGTGDRHCVSDRGKEALAF